MERQNQALRTRSSRTGNKFTPQQVTVLVVIGILNVLLIALGIYAWSLLRAPQSFAPGEPPHAAQPLPPTSTPGPNPTGQTPALNPTPPQPPECDSLAHEAQQGTVTRVVDRATIEINLNGAVVLASFAGINPPETSAALAVIQEMAEGQPVTLVKDVSESDDSGRLVRYVFAGGRFLNYELVRLGLARLQPNSPDRACAGLFQQAEQQARSGGIGIWETKLVPTATFVPFVTLDPNVSGGCDCSIRYECSDFSTHDEAQACYNVCNDYSSKLDEDRDGLACEFLP